MTNLIKKLYTKHLNNLVEHYYQIYKFDMSPNHTSYNNEGDARFPSNMPLIINIDVFLPIPKSKNINWKIDAAEGFIRPTTRPDTDNCAKVIKDALNGFAYYDDRQIISEHINKWYSSEPRVEVVIEGG